MRYYFLCYIDSLIQTYLCLFMLGSHVGHDCRLGNRIVLANNASLAGHVTLGDGVHVGGLSGVHQFVRIGEGAFIGALSMVTKDVIPFGMVYGERAKLMGLNLVGLRTVSYTHLTLPTKA